MMFLDCPAYLDRDGALRCDLPAEVQDRVTMPSTGGPVEILKVSCPAGHWFNGPLESLTRHGHGSPGESAAFVRDDLDAVR